MCDEKTPSPHISGDQERWPNQAPNQLVYLAARAPLGFCMGLNRLDFSPTRFLEPADLCDRWNIFTGWHLQITRPDSLTFDRLMEMLAVETLPYHQRLENQILDTFPALKDLVTEYLTIIPWLVNPQYRAMMHTLARRYVEAVNHSSFTEMRRLRAIWDHVLHYGLIFEADGLKPFGFKLLQDQGAYLAATQGTIYALHQLPGLVRANADGEPIIIAIDGIMSLYEIL